MIYFMRADSAVKIGFTRQRSSLSKRLEDLQSGNPKRITVVAMMAGDEEDEQRLHARFAQHRLTGEWFKLCDDLRTFIETNCRPCLHNDARPPVRVIEKLVRGGPSLKTDPLNRLIAKRDAEDRLSSFIVQRLAPGGKSQGSVLYGALTTWWALNAADLPIPSMNVFAAALAKRGYTKAKRKGRIIYSATLFRSEVTAEGSR